MTHFSDLGLAEPLLRAMDKARFESPTPIQQQVIPTMIRGQDILAVAQTGTGKTAAFALPLLHAATDRPLADRNTCYALILTPTRELAAQVVDHIRTCGKMMKYSVALIVGGVRHVPQKRAIERGVDIIVATPGRLEDHMSTGLLDLSQTATLVLDEADQMLDMGFAPAMRRIADACADNRQTVLLSATMPQQIRKLARDLLTDPVEVSVARESEPCEAIEQRVVYVDAQQKRDTLVKLLHEQDVKRSIVFTRTKHGADKTCYHLEKAGLNAQALHGDKSQQQRERIMRAFRDGRINILVATDVAARGIDIMDISHVVNYELPILAEAYVHRIGRTGRAGRSGTAVSLCDPSEKNLLFAIERIIGQRFNHAGIAEAFNFSEEDRNRSFDEQRKRGSGKGGRRTHPKHGSRGSFGAKGGFDREQGGSHKRKPFKRSVKPPCGGYGGKDGLGQRHHTPDMNTQKAWDPLAGVHHHANSSVKPKRKKLNDKHQHRGKSDHVNGAKKEKPKPKKQHS